MTSRPLFERGRFRLRSGLFTDWRINCEQLCHESIATNAMLIARKLVLPFGRVEGVPRGGLELADALQEYVVPGDPHLLIVDDVLSTGGAMEEHRAGREAYGMVMYDRSAEQGSKCPDWIGAVWRY